MGATYPLTLLYDAACPVCALEMDHLRARNRAHRLVFVNIAAPDFNAALYGTSLAALNAEIHAVRPDGTVLRGIEVLRLAYEAVGLGWVLRPTAWGPLRPVFDAGYRLFARHRMLISRTAGPLIRAVRGWRARQRARALAQRMRECAASCDRLSQPSNRSDRMEG
jgi:predicted DCC family thiol-disulfide oxidoreductase YuxK